MINKYEAWLSYKASEPDQGQSNVTDKGLDRATDLILARRIALYAPPKLVPDELGHLCERMRCTLMKTFCAVRVHG
jgi:hypothetical protein